MVAQGQSVRSACLKLSDGDLCKMTRLQNKFQNMKRKLKQPDNIIPFKQTQKTLTDADINSLFLGLVKLIKKTAMDEAKQNVQPANELLRKAFLDLNKKDKEITDLKSEFEKLKTENQKLTILLEKDKKNALQQHILSKRQKDETEKSKRV